MDILRKLVVQTLWVICCVSSGVICCADQQLPTSWREDAELRDVFFIDTEHGWAVGDLGTVWHTENGGEKWRLQATNHECQFSSVHFVDRDHGWIAGGHAVPLTGRSVGVVLETQDGGRTWSRLPGLLLPWINKIHFDSTARGHAVGLATPLDPTGVWTTIDGGKTWNPVRGVSGEHWRDAAFRGKSAVLLSPSGQVAWLRSGRLVASRQTAPGTMSNTLAAAMIEDNMGLAGLGQPQITVDGGTTWHPLGSFSGAEDSAVAIRSATVAGRRSWAAGSPGTRIFYSEDYARTYRAALSNATLPINCVHFVNEQDGWAVGAGGQILRSEDGGESWRTQRGMAKRAALLGVFADQHRIPWELLAEAAAVGQYRVHVVVLAVAPAEDRFACPVEQQLQDAAQRVGASAEVLTRLPMDGAVEQQVGPLLHRWERLVADPSDAVSGRLTQLLRVWRPHVVVTSHALPDHERPQGVHQLLGKMLADAVEMAANEQSYSHQLSGQGLQPWTVTRALSVEDLESESRQPVDRLTLHGRSVKGVARECRRLLSAGAELPPGPWSLASLSSDGETVALGRNPFSGLNVAYESSSRRKRTVQAIDFGTQRSQLRRQAHITGLLRSGGKFVGSGDQKIEQALQLLDSLEPTVAADMMFAWAESERRAGDLLMGDEILKRFVTRYPQHGLTDGALTWSMGLHTSAEYRLRRDVGEHGTEDVAPRSLAPEGAATYPILGNQDVSSIAPTEVGMPAEKQPAQPWQTAFRLGRELKSKRPQLYAEPAIMFPLAAIARDDDQMLSAQGFYRRAMALPVDSMWRRRAAAELTLLEGNPSDDRELVCRRVDSRPHLDGELDDACWIAAEFVTLDPCDPLERAADADPVTSVALTCDEGFLYLAARCRKLPDVKYLPPRRPRPRDADLKAMDRLVIALDSNRDYVSWWSLQIDQRGWTHEAVLGDASWNPEYFVASAETETAWTIELAIPWEELSPSERAVGSPWALGISRVIPRKRVERWNPAGLAKIPANLQGLMRVE